MFFSSLSLPLPIHTYVTCFWCCHWWECEPTHAYTRPSLSQVSVFASKTVSVVVHLPSKLSALPQFCVFGSVRLIVYPPYIPYSVSFILPSKSATLRSAVHVCICVQTQNVSGSIYAFTRVFTERILSPENVRELLCSALFLIFAHPRAIDCIPADTNLWVDGFSIFYALVCTPSTV